MRLSAYLLFMLAITLSLFFLGIQTTATKLLTTSQTTVINNTNVNYTMGNSTISVVCTTGDPTCQQSQNTPNIMWAFFAILLGAVGLVVLLSGFAAMYIIPALIFVAIANFVALPYDFLLQSDMPAEIKVAFIVIFNFITIISAVDFVRGGA